MARQTKNISNARKRKNITNSTTHIKATFNNTIITMTALDGSTICWCSSGAVGFKGAKKSTPFAAQTAAEKVAKVAIENGIQQTEIIINGPGGGRETATRAIQAAGIRITIIKDITPIPHNGCRPPKKT
uniref:Small ribosomal subunit protein uS11c n=1 Tax=Neogoniolithon spectabile TaxID=231755 RepID=A0A3G3MGR6_9FLOR|nr:ribosomal protein S11 [Neogoniolithon spectabile]AYR06017.1 ribosomal protein S11 [Neogoniolithon spectabile]